MYEYTISIPEGYRRSGVDMPTVLGKLNASLSGSNPKLAVN